MSQRSWLHNHALSLVIATVLLIWIALYVRSDRTTHLGAFYGNAAADWLGSLVTVLGTKFFYETGSAESRVPPILRRHTPHWLHRHSLSVVLVVTWVGWIWWYAAIEPGGKTGEVVGNVVSEWSQILSLVWFTKYLIEKGSKERSPQHSDQGRSS